MTHPRGTSVDMIDRKIFMPYFTYRENDTYLKKIRVHTVIECQIESEIFNFSKNNCT